MNSFKAQSRNAKNTSPDSETSRWLVWTMFTFLCGVVLFLDIHHLMFALGGAAVFGLLHLRLREEPKSKDALLKKVDDPYDDDHTTSQISRQRPRPTRFVRENKPPPVGSVAKDAMGRQMPSKPMVATPSVAPLKAPEFQSSSWDEQVDELLSLIRPTEGNEISVQKIVEAAQKAVQKAIPEAEVVGFACGDISRGMAFGVVVPDVEIVVQCHPDALRHRMHLRLQKSIAGKVDPDIDARKLQKSAIRACADLLVDAGFKFRRSAFRGSEPKVTLLAPPFLTPSERAIPIDFLVNALTPLYSATLTTAAAALDPRVLELCLLVKRWTKDRGICHAAKGHLPPYAWHILTIFFLQAGLEEPMLPPMKQFDWSACTKGQLKIKAASSTQPWKVPEKHNSLLTPTLLREFFAFYRNTVNWTTEAVSLRCGQRGPLKNLTPVILASHEMEGAGSMGAAKAVSGQWKVALSIEDPFEPEKNLANYLSAWALARMKEEFARADDLCKQGTGLAELLALWIPPASVESNDQGTAGGNSDAEA